MDYHRLEDLQFCDMSNGKLSEPEKLWIGQKLFHLEISFPAMQAKTNIPLATLKKYKYAFRDGIMIGDSYGGRPPTLDGIAKKELVQLVSSSEGDQKAKRTDFIEETILDLHKQTRKRRGLSSIGVTKPDPLTVKRIKKSLKMSDVKGQNKTKARVTAESDIRNYVSTAAMFQSKAKDLSPHCIGNWDSTQFAIHKENSKLLVTVQTAKERKKTPVTTTGDTGTGVYVKLLHTHNAAGVVAAPIFIVQDTSMSEGTFSWYKVPGLSHNTNTDAYGYLVMCKSRACNIAFYRWYIRTIVCPFYKQCRENFVSQVTNGGGGILMGNESTEHPAESTAPEHPLLLAAAEEVARTETLARLAELWSFVTCDGEAKQLEIFADPEIIALLAECGIDIGKLPASTSGSTQASDVSDLFKGLKAKLKRLESSTCAGDIDLASRLKLIIDKFHSSLKGAEGNLLVDGIVRIVTAISKVMSRSIVEEGYLRTGQYPVDIERTLQSCKNKHISEDDYQRILTNMPHFVAEFDRDGRLSETTMTELGVPLTTAIERNGKPKDQRVLHQQRAVVITHAESVRRREAYLARQAELKLIAAQKKAATRAKKAATADKAPKKVSAKKVSKKEATNKK